MQGDPYIRSSDVNRIDRYVFESSKPERKFFDSGLAALHDEFVRAIGSFASVSAVERVPSGGDSFVISVKAGGYQENYDARYREQMKALMGAAEKAWEAWKAYIQAATLFRHTHGAAAQGGEADPLPPTGS